MNDASLATRPSGWKWRLFQVFKYSIYLLLTVNMFGFLQEAWMASAHTFRGGIPLAEMMNAFTAALDSGAWIVLLLLFELETYVIPDERLLGGIKWSLHLGRALCYIVIVYAIVGYYNKMLLIYEFEPSQVTNVCEVLGDDVSMAIELDGYEPLTSDNCGTLEGQELFYHSGIQVFSDEQTLSVMKRMAWTDVVNASVWILIVIVLELEVYLSSSKLFGSRIYVIYKSSKLLLYGTLFVAAVYWWMFGTFLDFWDAFLWLVAFFFIELNVIQWQEEVHEHMMEEAGVLS